MNEVLQQILSYLKGIWRFRWIALATSWAVALTGAVIIYSMPNQFQASARLYADTQSILKPLLSGLAVQPNVEQELNILSRTLISRPNVEKVLRMTDMDLSAKTTLDKDRLIQLVSTSTTITGTGRDNLYTINFTHQNPETARRVVQAFLTLFVESSMGDKRKDSESARRFLEEQIKAYEQKLVQAENALKEFKQKNMGVMPDSGKDFLGRLNEVNNQLNQARLELREQEQIRETLRRQLSGETASIGDPAAMATIAVPEIDGRLEIQRKNLDALRLQFTEEHPDVVQTKRLIADLEKQRTKEIELRKSQGTLNSSNPNPVFQQMRIALSQAESNIASLKARVAEYQARQENLRKNADTVPQVEADLVQLNRDYEINKRNYEQLLARRESAQISGEMDATTGVADFRIIDPPRVPNKPSSPNRGLLLLGALFGALAAGGALAFILSQVWPTYMDRRSLREDLGIPVLGTVALLRTPEYLSQHRKRLALFFTGTGILIICYGAVTAYAFWRQLA